MWRSIWIETRDQAGSDVARSSRQLPQHVVQDAAVAEVLQLVERIDAAGERHRFPGAIREGDLGVELLAGLELAGEAADRHRLVAAKPERLPGRALLEDERHDA